MGAKQVMKYVHVRNLDKYHPKYKDRELQWCKAYFTMLNADPDFELVPNEVDKWRFIAFVMLELQIKQPVPLDECYLRRKGFDLKIRPISMTLKMLHNFLEIVPKPSRREEKEEDKEKKSKTAVPAPQDFIEAIKNNPAYKHIDIDSELSKMDAWLLTKPGRKKNQRFVLNWLNRIEKPITSHAKKPEVAIKCSVPGCKEQPMGRDAYLEHVQKCEKRFKDANSGPLPADIRTMIDNITGKNRRITSTTSITTQDLGETN